MWIEKLADGVLRVLTPIGPRYIKPRFVQRVQLLWIFRHFETLPQQVLSRWQQELIDSLCAGHAFFAPSNGMEDLPIIGTLERRPPMSAENLPPRRPSSSVGETVAPLAANVRQRS